MTALAPRMYWKPLVIAAALAFAYASVLAKLGRDWWMDENYSHGLLIPFIIGFILWSERDRWARAAQRPQVAFGGAMIAAAFAALWAGTVGAELFVQRMSLVLMLAGLVVYFWGWRLLRLTLVPLFLLVLAIPIPTILFNKIALPLQLFASRCAVWAMRQFDIPVLRDGNVIELLPLNASQTKKLEVVEACSGIRSLMTLVTLAVIFAYFTHPRGSSKGDGSGSNGTGKGTSSGGAPPRRNPLTTYGFWRSGLLVLSAVPIAIVTNAARVSGTGILAHYYGTEVADGFFHSFSGWVVYIVAFLLLFVVGWLLDRAGHIGKRGGPRGGAKAASEVKLRAAKEAPETREPAAPIPVEARVKAEG